MQIPPLNCVSKCVPQCCLANKQLVDDDANDAGRIPLDDSIRMAEFIVWTIDDEMWEYARIDSRHSLEIQEQFFRTCTRLYTFCGRMFLVQLVHSYMNRNLFTSIGTVHQTAILGYIKLLHQQLCRSDDQFYSITDGPQEILNKCLEVLQGDWQRFKTSSPFSKSRSMHSRRMSWANERKEPSAHVASKLKSRPKNLQGAQKVDAESRNYRLAYAMIVGLDCSIKLAEGLRLYRHCMYGLGPFVHEVASELRDYGYNTEKLLVQEVRKFCETEFSADLVMLALSAMSLKYDLPSKGTKFSQEHLLGDDQDLWFVELAPELFQEVRKLCQVSSQEYKQSVAKTSFSFIEFETNSKSGELFFFSHDGKFLIKTISRKEAMKMIKMLPEYLNHISQKPSLLMRICGLYRVSVSKDQVPKFFFVALSVFDTGDLGLHKQYDVKGSTYGRTSNPSDSVRKDNDWINEKMEIHLPVGLKRSLAYALEEDSRFLKKQSVLDYSILIGIHDRASNDEGVKFRGVKLLQGILRKKILPLIRAIKNMKEASKQEVKPIWSGQEKKPWKFAQTFSHKVFAGTSSIKLDDLKPKPLVNQNGQTSPAPADTSVRNSLERTTDLEISNQGHAVLSEEVDSCLPSAHIPYQIKRDLDDLSRLTPNGMNEISEMENVEDANRSSLSNLNKFPSPPPWQVHTNAHHDLDIELPSFTRVSSAPAMTQQQKEEIDFDELKKRFVIEKKKFAQNKKNEATKPSKRKLRHNLLSVFTDFEGEARIDRLKGWEGLHGPICGDLEEGENGRFIYFIGIIDFLIPWDSRKKAEFCANLMLGKGLAGSCVPPNTYAKRQTDFVISKMLGLFDIRSANSYASSSMFSIPPRVSTPLDEFLREWKTNGNYHASFDSRTENDGSPVERGEAAEPSRVKDTSDLPTRV